MKGRKEDGSLRSSSRRSWLFILFPRFPVSFCFTCFYLTTIYIRSQAKRSPLDVPPRLLLCRFRRQRRLLDDPDARPALAQGKGDLPRNGGRVKILLLPRGGGRKPVKEGSKGACEEGDALGRGEERVSKRLDGASGIWARPGTDGEDNEGCQKAGQITSVNRHSADRVDTRGRTAERATLDAVAAEC